MGDWTRGLIENIHYNDTILPRIPVSQLRFSKSTSLSQGQNLAWTGLFVPSWLNSGHQTLQRTLLTRNTHPPRITIGP